MIRSVLAQGIRLISGVRARSSGLTGPAIFYANHASHLDFAVIWAALPPREREQLAPAAAEDYWGKTRLRRYVAHQLFRAVLIPRSGITRANHPVEKLSQVLTAGRSVLIFPEGTRGDGAQVAEFKSGLFHLAQRHPELPLVPIYLENLNRIMPKGSVLFVPIIATAHVRQPLQLQLGEGKQAFLIRARQALLDS
jgi:1-acyl-sn-glycerol-3-phosphate acyltransferase